MGVAQKVPGESEEITSKQLVFSERIYVYHETYLSPEEVIDLRNGFQKLGGTILFRSADYLANRKLEAKVKQLEGNKNKSRTVNSNWPTTDESDEYRFLTLKD